jgi:hypothetical protein
MTMWGYQSLSSSDVFCDDNLYRGRREGKGCSSTEVHHDQGWHHGHILPTDYYET